MPAGGDLQAARFVFLVRDHVWFNLVHLFSRKLQGNNARDCTTCKVGLIWIDMSYHWKNVGLQQQDTTGMGTVTAEMMWHCWSDFGACGPLWPNLRITSFAFWDMVFFREFLAASCWYHWKLRHKESMYHDDPLWREGTVYSMIGYDGYDKGWWSNQLTSINLMCHRDFQAAIVRLPIVGWPDPQCPHSDLRSESPKVPPEVIWLIACGCQRKHYYPRDTLASWQILMDLGRSWHSLSLATSKQRVRDFLKWALGEGLHVSHWTGFIPALKSDTDLRHLSTGHWFRGFPRFWNSLSLVTSKWKWPGMAQSWSTFDPSPKQDINGING